MCTLLNLNVVIMFWSVDAHMEMTNHQVCVPDNFARADGQSEFLLIFEMNAGPPAFHLLRQNNMFFAVR